MRHQMWHQPSELLDEARNHMSATMRLQIHLTTSAENQICRMHESWLDHVCLVAENQYCSLEVEVLVAMSSGTEDKR